MAAQPHSQVWKRMPHPFSAPVRPLTLTVATFCRVALKLHAQAGEELGLETSGATPRAAGVCRLGPACPGGLADRSITLSPRFAETSRTRGGAGLVDPSNRTVPEITPPSQLWNTRKRWDRSRHRGPARCFLAV